MAVRSALKTDAGDLSALVTSLSRFYLCAGQQALPAWLSDSLRREAFEERLESDAFDSLVYELGGEVVGYVSVSKGGHVHHLFVCKEHQGQGIARALWEAVIIRCKAAKYTVRSSLYAVPVYRSFGFVESAAAGEKDGVRFQPMELSL